MSSIHVFAHVRNERGLLATIDGDLATTHSALVRDFVAQQPRKIKYEITLIGAAPAAFKHILQEMLACGKTRQLHVNVHRLSIDQAIAIHEASIVLRIEPAQAHMEQHLVGYMAHNIPPPGTMIRVHKVYKCEESRIWSAMVHNMAYHFVGQTVSDKRILALHAAAQPFAILIEAINEKIDELKARKERVESARERQAAGLGRRGRRK